MLRSIEGLISDVRYARRQIVSSRSFALAVCSALTLGIGVNVTLFSFANWLLRQPVSGIERPKQLVAAMFRDHAGRPALTSYPNLRDLKDHVSAFSDLAGYQDGLPVAVYADGHLPSYLHASFASENFFRVLGLRVSPGRQFLAEDAFRPDSLTVVVISNRLWHTWFGADPRVVGRPMTVNGVHAQVVGVAPPGFRGLNRLGDTDLWIPASAIGAIAYHGLIAPPLEERGEGVFRELVGRLTPAAKLEDALIQMRTISANMRAHYQAEDSLWADPEMSASVGIPLTQREVVHRALGLLESICILVFLVACANVANLMVCRSAKKRAEWIVRRSLGTPISRLLRLLVVESTGFASLAVLPSVLLALGLTRLLDGTSLPGLGTVTGVKLNLGELSFAVCLALIAGVLAGLAPGFSALRTDLGGHLQRGVRTIVRQRSRLRGALAGAQVALSMSMLVLSFVATTTIRTLRRVDVGFDADSVLAFSLAPSMSGFRPSASLSVFREALVRIRKIPGVDAVALAAAAPFTPALEGRARAASGTASDSGARMTPAWVSSDYFRAMGIRMLRGTTFQQDEFSQPESSAAAQREVVLSHSLAVKMFGDSDAIGRVVRLGPTSTGALVVGIAADSRWTSLSGNRAEPIAYSPVPNIVGATGATFLVRSSLPRRELARQVQGAVSEASRLVPMFDVAYLRERINRQMAETLLVARVITLLTLLAAAVTIVGIYTVVAFYVTEHARELSVRSALGASPSSMFALVMGRAAKLATVGAVVGLAGGVVAIRLISNRVFGIQSVQPVVYAASLGAMILMVLAAVVPPAWTVVRMNISTTLRAD